MHLVSYCWTGLFTFRSLQTLGEQRIQDCLKKEGCSEIDECALKERVEQEVRKKKRELFEEMQKKVSTIELIPSGLI